MTHARIPDFSQPVPIRRPVVLATAYESPCECRSLAAPSPDKIDPAIEAELEQFDAPGVRAPGPLNVAGEMLAVALIIAGGVFAYGFMPFA